jgi:hypothetical protein
MNTTPENTERQIQIYSPNPYLIRCPICLENPVNKTTACSHHFCEECIDSWMREHSTCPLCRANINNGTNDETQVDLENRIRIYGMNYNFLRIMSGMGGLAYSN